MDIKLNGDSQIKGTEINTEQTHFFSTNHKLIDSPSTTTYSKLPLLQIQSAVDTGQSPFTIHII